MLAHWGQTVILLAFGCAAGLGSAVVRTEQHGGLCLEMCI